jgi:hypothetical protein
MLNVPNGDAGVLLRGPQWTEKGCEAAWYCGLDLVTSSLGPESDAGASPADASSTAMAADVAIAVQQTAVATTNEFCSIGRSRSGHKEPHSSFPCTMLK